MKCPHCDKKVSLFSKALNKFGKTKKCPHCSENIKVFISFKMAAILFIPFIVIALFILKPLFISFGLSGSLATGVLCGLLIVFSSRLKSVS